MPRRKQTPRPQKKRSKPETILIALFLKKDQIAFTLEDIVVIAWELDKTALGLKGYTEKYPCSNKVESSIMGARGITKRGWLRKNETTGRYLLTQAGKELAATLLGLPLTTDDGNYQKLPPEKEEFILKMRAHTAFQKFNSGEKTDILFTEACRFWGIDERTKRDAVIEKLDALEATIRKLADELEMQDARLSQAQVISAGDIRTMLHAHSHMKNMFERRLNVRRDRN